MTDTYPMPPEGWTCFHCGEKFTTPGSARDHFGGDPNALAACQIKAGEELGLVMALRKAEKDRDDWSKLNASLGEQVEFLEAQVNDLTSGIRQYKPFSKCNSIRDVFNVYDSMEGRALAAEERIKIGRKRDGSPDGGDGRRGQGQRRPAGQ